MNTFILLVIFISFGIERSIANSRYGNYEKIFNHIDSVMETNRIELTAQLTS